MTHIEQFPSSRRGAMMNTVRALGCRAAALLAATLCWQGGLSQAAETAAAPAKAPMAPAGQYHLDKSHASLVLRVNHMGFSTYTTRFSRFEAQLTFDPNNIAASQVLTTIDAASFEMDAAPSMCLDIVKGPKLLDIAKFPQIVFKSDHVRMTGANSMLISRDTDPSMGLRGRWCSPQPSTAVILGRRIWTPRPASGFLRTVRSSARTSA